MDTKKKIAYFQKCKNHKKKKRKKGEYYEEEQRIPPGSSSDGSLSITVSLAAPAFAGTYYIDNGDITVTKNADGSQTVEQNGTSNNDSDEIIITTTGAAITTLESDLEGPAAEIPTLALW